MYTKGFVSYASGANTVICYRKFALKRLQTKPTLISYFTIHKINCFITFIKKFETKSIEEDSTDEYVSKTSYLCKTRNSIKFEIYYICTALSLLCLAI